MFERPVITEKDQKFMDWSVENFRKLSPNLQSAVIAAGMLCCDRLRDVEMKVEADKFMADSYAAGKEIYGE